MRVLRYLLLAVVIGAAATVPLQGQLSTAPQDVKPLTGIPTGEEWIEPIDDALEAQIIELTNQERIKSGLQPLGVLTELTAAARYHAYDMAVDNYYTHVSQDRVNDTLTVTMKMAKRIKCFYSASEKYNSIGENIYMMKTKTATANDAVIAWLKSPGHKANMLRENYKWIGVGYYKVGLRHYFVQVFSSK